ncbi:MAG: hypothetical protein Q8L00_09075, partial [Deltaproteobacteria bacterium]|nr:hypothetical protein [Deltaproteobacteria bacterium]
MKKFIIFGVVLALLVPSMAMAATEFSLGGFIKMDMMWDSDGNVGKNMNGLPSRNNDPNNKHGRLKFTAQGSRFNLTIKGPDLWGAKTSGFIEMDFDSTEKELLGAGFTASKSYTPRMRHAMFRFNWPTSELLFGQYFSMFSEWYAESAEDGPLQMTGTPTARLAQVRFSQTFLSDWTVAGLIGDPNQAFLNTGNVGPYNANINNGQSAETPQIQGKIKYAHDFWGKAAYYGKPIPFTVQLVGGWQRNVMRNNSPVGFNASGFGEQAAVTGFIVNRNQYVHPWMAMGSLFIPVIPTSSANLAGTASILTQWWIGQGIEAFGFTGTSGAKYRFDGFVGGPNLLLYDAELLNNFGGFVEGQYYFNNQWFVNALYGLRKAFNVSRAQWLNTATIAGREMGFNNANEPQTVQQMSATLWYRPIQAIKFGLQYSYAAARYFAYANPNASL